VDEVTAQAGLRERKKARTRAAIREHAVRLFSANGYQATTVEQIAAAAEVSPSTFFRYFPTKEDLVLQDDLDIRVLEAFARQPAGVPPVAAIRAAVKEAFGSFTDAEMEQVRVTTELSLNVPEIRARAMDEFTRTIAVIGQAVADRSGRSPDELPVRALAGAVVGVIMSVSLPWSSWQAEPDVLTLSARIDEALDLLESGLPL
jgi:AcrR family transcriptional regulator